MVKLIFSRNQILTVLWLTLFFIFSQAGMTEGNQKKPTLRTESCTISDVLTKICRDKKIEIYMNKINLKKVPYDYKDSGNIKKDINNLVESENCTVIWNYKHNRLTSVDIVFTENSSSNSNNASKDTSPIKEKSPMIEGPNPAENPVIPPEQAPSLPPS